MVHAVGLRIFLLLAVVDNILSLRGTTINDQVIYGNLQHRSHSKNIKLSSLANHVKVSSKLPPKHAQTTEIRIIKHPNEKIVHHPSKIHFNRPPTYVTINHPDIVIERNPVVYHKPAAVVRSPIIYKNLPRKIEYQPVVKHIIKPIEKNIVIEDKHRNKPKCHIFTQKIVTTRQPPPLVHQRLTASNRFQNRKIERISVDKEIIHNINDKPSLGVR